MRNYLIIGVSLAALSTPLAAQEQEEGAGSFSEFRPEETQITVTATGTRIELEDTGQPVTVIGEEEIESVQGADLTRVLERVPGLVFSRNGGPGAVTGVRVRGAQGEQLLVLIDGVRVSDPAAPSGGFDFGNLLSSNLSKIEILRGSNSTIWGSDAIGGVLVASTRAESGLEASAEYGARDTLTGAVSGGIGGDRGFLGGSASYYRTDGFSQAASGIEADGFEQWAANGQGRLYLSRSFEVFARGRWVEGDLDLDGFPAPDFVLADTDETQHTRQYSASTGAIYDTGPLFVSAAYSFADTERVNRAAPGTDPNFTSDGHSDRVEVRGEWRPIGPLLVNFGAEHEWSAYGTLFEERRTTRIFGAYGQLGIEMGGLAAHAGVRIDDHARFGSEVSFGGDLSYALGGDFRLRASVGEGFKAPTLYRLFSDFGNEQLEAEHSTSYDIGLVHGDRSLSDTRFFGAATVFRRDTRDQIEFASCFQNPSPICSDRPFGYFENLGRVRAEGIEVELGARPSDRWVTRAVYAWVDTENRTGGSANEGNALARRPHHALTLSADWRTPLADFTIGGDVRMVSDSFDDAANTVPLDGYALASVRASIPFGERFELFGRVENLFDADYQTAAGYATAGRSAYIGARARF